MREEKIKVNLVQLLPRILAVTHVGGQLLIPLYAILQKSQVQKRDTAIVGSGVQFPVHLDTRISPMQKLLTVRTTPQLLKTNGRYQVGSGCIVTFTHDTSFIGDSISNI